MLANINTATKRRTYTFVVVGIIAGVLIMVALLLTTELRGPHGNVAPSQGVDFGKLPLSFEPNRGQADPSVKYMTHASGGTMYFTPSEVVLALESASSRSDSNSKGQPSDATSKSVSYKADKASEAQPTTGVLRLQFIGANPNAVMSSGEALPGKVNYFIGNDPSKWHTGLPTYAGTRYENLYPGIDLKYEGTGGQLKGTYTVAPGADPALILWRYVGAKSVHVDEAGNMQVVLSGDGDEGTSRITVTERAPVAWQEIDEKQVGVKVLYKLTPDNDVSFAPAGYDHNYPLVIDPPLSYSTYLGGNGSDYGYGIAVDTSGNAYVTGSTQSTNFPLQNPFQPAYGGSTYDMFVTKLSATGSTLLYSTYLGGTGGDNGYGIAVDASGNAYVTGSTYSADFPLQNAFQPAYGGGVDAFVTKLSATGSALVYSTYLGGSDGEDGYGITVDASGNAYVIGTTSSTNFPLLDPFQPAYGGGVDTFVTKFSATGSTLAYSTYLGGSSEDLGDAIAVDTSGNAYVTGYTGSTNFPLQNPFQPTFGGNNDAFVTKLSPTGSTLLYSTYLGGSYYDYPRAIAVDTSGNAYVTGSTRSTNFPLQNPFQPRYGGSNADVFVTKFSAAGSTLLYSTYLGGNGDEVGYGLAVDTSGSAYVTGITFSVNFPLQNPLQPTYGGGNDVFVTKLSATGSTLLYSTYLGGSGGEGGNAIAVDASGNAYVTGMTYSTDFPQQNPFQSAYGGGDYDAFVAKIPCPISFSDVQPTDYFYGPVLYLACHGAISGYSDGNFRPFNNTTRGQLSKITVLALGWTLYRPATPTFSDVLPTDTFYAYIETAYQHNIISGYSDSTFKPGNNVTRGQLSKIVVLAMGWPLYTPVTPTFSDVDTGNAFYSHVETAYQRGIISGYADSTFKPGNNATRGQIGKIVYGAISAP